MKSKIQIEMNKSKKLLITLTASLASILPSCSAPQISGAVEEIEFANYTVEHEKNQNIASLGDLIGLPLRFEKNYETIKKYNREFSERFITGMMEVSNDFKINYEQNREKTISNYEQVNLMALGSAFSRLTDKPEKNIDEIANSIYDSLVLNSVYSSKYIDYNKKEVKENAVNALKKWYSVRIRHYEQMLASDDCGKGFSGLMQSAYKCESALDSYLTLLNGAIGEMYESFKGGVGTFTGLIVKKKIEETRLKNMELYRIFEFEEYRK